MNWLIGSVIALAATAWGASVVDTLHRTVIPEDGMLWFARAEALTLSGLLAFALMSLAMLLATRPVWLERPVGGLDRIYRTHKWAGILAATFALLHWLIEMSDDIIRKVAGRAGRLRREHGNAFYEFMRDVGDDIGEWAVYVLLTMVVIALLRRLPFKPWRSIHRAMPALYLLLAIHAAFLAPPGWWLQPAGWLLAAMLAVGSWAAVLALLGRIGRRRQATGEVVSVTARTSELTEVTCRLGPAWKGHRAGQFAFLTLHVDEGAHPFTIASADRGDGCVVFQIKALGDYTRGLARRLAPGLPVIVEGPYGRFDFRSGEEACQIWIAGGVGVTPFLARLESYGPGDPDVSLHYCTRDEGSDPFVSWLRNRCAALRNVTLTIRDTRRDGPLTLDGVYTGLWSWRDCSIWFCGPSGFGDALQRELAGRGLGRVPFNRELFEFR